MTDTGTIISACRFGFYRMAQSGEIVFMENALADFANERILSGWHELAFSDYGKTWALTKEELMKFDMRRIPEALEEGIRFRFGAVAKVASADVGGLMMKDGRYAKYADYGRTWVLAKERLE